MQYRFKKITPKDKTDVGMIKVKSKMILQVQYVFFKCSIFCVTTKSKNKFSLSKKMTTTTYAPGVDQCAQWTWKSDCMAHSGCSWVCSGSSWSQHCSCEELAEALKKVGMIVGIVVGIVVFCILLVVLRLFCCKKKATDDTYIVTSTTTTTTYDNGPIAYTTNDCGNINGNNNNGYGGVAYNTTTYVTTTDPSQQPQYAYYNQQQQNFGAYPAPPPPPPPGAPLPGFVTFAPPPQQTYN